MEKTNKQTSDVILYDNRVVVFKMEGDVMMYVVGGAEENEVLLFSVVLALRDSLSILLKCVLHHPPYLRASTTGDPLTDFFGGGGCWWVLAKPDGRNSTDKRTIIENYDLVSLAIDEIVDDGIILETDPVIIASRVSKPPTQDMANIKNIDLSEQGLLNVWEFGKQKLAERMRQAI